MYLIKRTDDGHIWEISPEIEQPMHREFTKLYCVYCGAKAYTVDDERISLTGEYYSGEIRQCPGGKFKENQKPKLVRTKVKTTLIRTKKKLTLKRTK